jgi:pantetheine-phosphate adenylyltransferase
MDGQTAVYPGHFDPITYGHLDIIRRAQALFSTLIIAIVHHSGRELLFTPEERVRLTEAALAEEGIDGVEVICYDSLLIDLARSRGARAIVRGLRANSDFDYEFQMALMNRDLSSAVETVFLMTAGEYSFLSSSVVKEVKRYGGGVGSFVPDCVERALEKKLRPSG